MPSGSVSPAPQPLSAGSRDEKCPGRKDRQSPDGPPASWRLVRGNGPGLTRSPPRMTSLEASYAHAGRITKARARNFYYTFLLLPPERRRCIFAVYAFSRRADDAVDAVEEAGVPREQALSDLEDLRALLHGSRPEDPLAPALRDTIRRHEIPLEPFEELLAGMAMDLDKTHYETYEELEQYCYRAASVVGLISMEIFGYTNPRARLEAREPAIRLGLAMQLTNILRDVAEDLERGRIYLPAEDLKRFAYSREDLERRVVDDRFRNLMAHEVARARGLFREAEELYPRVLEESRYCPVLLGRFYSRILERIEAGGYDVLGRRPRLPLHEKLRIAGRTWLEARRSARGEARRAPTS